MLAGGLGPENVRAAIDAVHPWAVDSARSTESAPGIKDHAEHPRLGGGRSMSTQRATARTAGGTSPRR